MIAVWRYKHCNRFTRSKNFERIPQQWRYSAPPANCDDLMPCHVSYRLKSSHGYSRVEPAYERLHLFLLQLQSPFFQEWYWKESILIMGSLTSWWRRSKNSVRNLSKRKRSWSKHWAALFRMLKERLFGVPMDLTLKIRWVRFQG